MSKVIKVTKPTFNVLTDTDQRHFSLNSGFEAVMRLQDKGLHTATTPSGHSFNQTETIAHNLGYPPFFQLFIKWTNLTNGVTSEYLPATHGSSFNASHAPFGSVIVVCHPFVTANNLNIIFATGFVPPDQLQADCYYLIGRDPVA